MIITLAEHCSASPLKMIELWEGYILDEEEVGEITRMIKKMTDGG